MSVFPVLVLSNFIFSHLVFSVYDQQYLLIFSQFFFGIIILTLTRSSVSFSVVTPNPEEALPEASFSFPKPSKQEEAALSEYIFKKHIMNWCKVQVICKCNVAQIIMQMALLLHSDLMYKFNIKNTLHLLCHTCCILSPE